MRVLLVIAAAGVLALGLAAARGGADSTTAARAPLELRGSHSQPEKSRFCAAFRTIDPTRSYREYESRFQAYVRRLQRECGAARPAERRHHAVTPPKREPRRG